MAVTEVSTDANHHRLMDAIAAAVQAHTTVSPMAIDEIVGVLAFCTGSAIVSGCKAPSNQRKMRVVALANIDTGMDVMRRAQSGSSLILPGAGAAH